MICQSHIQYIHHKDLLYYTHNLLTTDNIQNEMIEIQKMIYGSPSFRQKNEKFMKQVEFAFKFIETQTRLLEKPLEIYVKHTQIEPSFLEKLEPEEINKQLELFKDENQILQNLDLTQDISIFQFDCSMLKQQIKNCANATIKMVHEKLPLLTYQRAHTLVTQLNQYYESVQRNPLTLKDFCPFVDSLNEIQHNIEQLSLDNMNNMSLLSLCQQHKMQVTRPQLPGHPLAGPRAFAGTDCCQPPAVN